MRFVDRFDAGRELAKALIGMHLEHPIVIALPRGGVPVGAAVARMLHAPLDVIVVRKLGYPYQPEVGMGAIAEGGITVMNRALITRLGVSNDQFEDVLNREAVELSRRVARYREGRTALAVRGKPVILVDDGLATGFTARAAIEAMRSAGATRVVLAVPVAPVDAIEELHGLADDVVCLQTPAWFNNVGEFYDDFAPVADDIVAELLREAGPVAKEVSIPVDGMSLPGTLVVPHSATGLVLFAHGTGSSRLSPRNVRVANVLQSAGLATLLFDLLSPAEMADRHNVFAVDMLARRLKAATSWTLQTVADAAFLPVGFFGASTGGAAALIAAADLGHGIGAIVSRGGRPDLAGDRLAEITAPTLLVVGGRDDVVLQLNRDSAKRLVSCPHEVVVVRGATHLFDEPGALDQVAHVARDWFLGHLTGARVL
jgi:predicted phosphoribosyltransferase/predicted alpha/beta-hydrolase family hydrolase